jgi:hypothetical protein
VAHYYEKHYPALFYHLYESSRTQSGFSPLASVRIAVSAALAAKTFQPTRSRAEAQAAMPYLVTYYGLMREAAPVAFDVPKTASRELDWWQARREAAAPRDYGVTIADVAALTYGKSKDDPALLAFGIGRRGDGLSRCARAGDHGAALDAYRDATARRLRTAQGGVVQ